MGIKYLILGVVAVVLVSTMVLSSTELYHCFFVPAGFLLVVLTKLFMPCFDHYRWNEQGFLEQQERRLKYMEEN